MVVILLCLCLLFTSCAYGPEEAFYRYSSSNKRTQSICELAAPDIPVPDSEVYTVAVFSDIHFGKKKETRREQEFLDWLQKEKDNGTAPAFCICLGDIADHGLESEFKEYVSFSQKVENILGSGKIYNVLGNHDLYNDGWEHYRRLIFPYNSIYHFNTQSFSWYCIDSASGTLGKKQYKKIQKAFEEDSAPKIVMAHIPVYSNPLINLGYYTFQNTYEADMLLTLFAKSNVKLVLNGHIHKAYKNYFNNCIELTVPSITSENKWMVITIDEQNANIKEELINGE